MVALTKPVGIPTTRSSMITTRTAAIGAPAILRTLMTKFQPEQTASRTGSGSHPAKPCALSLSCKTQGCSKGAKNNPGLLQTYVTYGTLERRRNYLRSSRGTLKGYCNEQAGRICGHIENESDVCGSRRRRALAPVQFVPHSPSRRRRGPVPEGRCGRRPVRGAARPGSDRDRRLGRQPADPQFHGTGRPVRRGCSAGRPEPYCGRDRGRDE